MLWPQVNTHVSVRQCQLLRVLCRFKHNPYVNGEPPVRFYCGTPLIASNGHRLGTLCFADNEAHTFDAERCNILNNMAELCVREIERDYVIRRQSMESTEQLVTALPPLITFPIGHTWTWADQHCTMLRRWVCNVLLHETQSSRQRCNDKEGVSPSRLNRMLLHWPAQLL